MPLPNVTFGRIDECCRSAAICEGPPGIYQNKLHEEKEPKAHLSDSPVLVPSPGMF